MADYLGEPRLGSYDISQTWLPTKGYAEECRQVAKKDVRSILLAINLGGEG